MPRCATCWTRFGRSLDESDCLCSPTTTVLQNSAFHAAMGKKLIPLPEKPQDAPKREERVFKAPRLTFGDKPQKSTRRNAQAK